jgi:hypothetical protein
MLGFQENFQAATIRIGWLANRGLRSKFEFYSEGMSQSQTGTTPADG